MHMYNPNSVAQSMIAQKSDSSWKNTSSFASINTFITMEYFTAPGYYNIILEMPVEYKSSGDVCPALTRLGRIQALHLLQEKMKEIDQGALVGYSDKILLVGINYNAEGKENMYHTCVIEEWRD